MPALSIPPRYRRWVRLAMVVAAICMLALVWKVTPLADYATPEHIRPLLESVRSTAWAVPAAIGIYTIAMLCFFPHMAMSAAVVLIFPPLEAICICMAGSLISASIGYGIGRRLGLRSARALVGDAAQKVSGYAKKGGVLGIALLRMLPIAPYMVVNLALAMLEVPFFVFLAGTFFGALPGAIIASLLGYSALELWENPSPENLMMVGGGVLAWLVVVAGSHLANRQWQRRKLRSAAK
ncbi:hypothetical protein GC177_08815 [bacterium]|nr:hypothetical protein [bacterium]